MIRRILLVIALVGLATLVVEASPAGAGCVPEGTQSVTVPDTTVSEGVGTTEVAVDAQTGGCPSSYDLDCFSAESDTAAAGDDFEAVNETIDLTQDGTVNVGVTILDDSEIEESEFFDLTCELVTSGPTPVSAGGGSEPSIFARAGGTVGDTGRVTITDNDEAPPTTTTAAPTTTTTAPPTGTVTPDNPNPGDDVDLTASGFKGGSDAEIFFLSEPILLTTATADSGGVVRATITIPEDAQAGAHTIEVRGVDSSDTPRTVSIPITVAGEVTDTTAATQPLAATGSGLSTLILVAGVLAAAGGALLLQVRRRRTAGAS